MISIVNVSEEDFQKYSNAIHNSDLDKFIKWELIDILKTARTQTDQAKSIGWL